METKRLSNGWELQWISKDGRVIHASARKGRCRIHKDGPDSYTAYLHNPFVAVGIYSTFEEAATEAEEYERKSIDSDGHRDDLFHSDD